MLSISKCLLFKNITLEELNNLFLLSRGIVKNYHKDAIIRFQGDEYTDLLIIIEGEISAEIQNLDGKKIIIETLNASSAIATGVLFASDNALPVTVIANTDVKVVLFSRNAVMLFCQRNKNFLLNYLKDTGDKIIFLAEKIRLLKFKSINQKIASYLLNLSNKQRTESIKMICSRQQLADLFGVARPSVSRGFSGFYKPGILKREGKTIHILDKKQLYEIMLGESRSLFL